MGLASSEWLVSLPLSIYILTANVKGMHQWVSWEVTHDDFSRVDAWPLVVLQSFPATWTVISITRWILPYSAFGFFVFFGLAGESINNYRRFYYWAVKPLGITPPSPVPRTWGSPPSATNSAMHRNIAGPLSSSVSLKNANLFEAKSVGDLESQSNNDSCSFHSTGVIADTVAPHISSHSPAASGALEPVLPPALPQLHPPRAAAQFPSDIV